MDVDDEPQMYDSPSTGAPYLADITEEIVTAQVDQLREIWGSQNWTDREWITKWLTLAQLDAMTNQPQSSLAANLRSLRKPEHGAHHLDVRKRGTKVWHYRLWKPGTHTTKHRHCVHYKMAIQLGMIDEDAIEEAILNA